jgi:(E)-4-hydroxy-3-methyl-but-2-enyl pyrophosphate reductase
VLGGGVVDGSFILVGGDPGIGKSTLLTQVCANMARSGINVLYVSGEESARQIKLRTNRLGAADSGFFVLSENDVSIIESKEEAENFTISGEKNICIVSQTTFNYNKFQDLVEIVSKKGYNISVLNTICNATEERQTEARQIAKEVEAMIVIGDKHSSNTQKLFEICNTECEKTYYIQTSKDMDYSLLESINNVGITAGASTPNNIIEEVSKNVRNEL